MLTYASIEQMMLGVPADALAIFSRTEKLGFLKRATAEVSAALARVGPLPTDSCTDEVRDATAAIARHEALAACGLTSEDYCVSARKSAEDARKWLSGLGAKPESVLEGHATVGAAFVHMAVGDASGSDSVDGEVVMGEDMYRHRDRDDCSDEVREEGRFIATNLHSAEVRLGKDICDVNKHVSAESRLVGKEICDVGRQVSDESGSIRKDICDAMASVKDATRGETREIFAAISASTAAMSKGFADTMLEGCKNTDSVRSSLCDGFKDTAVALASGFKDVQVGFERQSTLAEKLAAAAQLEATKNASAAALTASQNHYQTLLQFKDAQLEASKNAAEAAKQLAACCCELKEKIDKDGESTRALVRQTDQERLREALSDAKQKVLALEARFACCNPCGNGNGNGNGNNISAPR